MKESKGWREVDLELIAFLERYASSLIKWDIVMFFAQNPYTRDTSDNIALRLGRDRKAIALELYDLALLGFLEREVIDDTPVYRLTSDAILRKLAWRMSQKYNALKA